MLRQIILGTVALSLTLSGLAGCSNSSTPAPEPNHTEHGQGHLHAERIETFEAHPQLQTGSVVIERDETFEQVGFHYSTTSTASPRYRIRYTDGQWASWKDLNITWSEGQLRVGRILLDAEAEAIELDRAAGVLSGKIEFYEDIVAHPGILTRDLPRTGAPDVSEAGEALARQQVAPSSLVIPRDEWGARDPDRVCGRSHDPYRMSIHHTYLPANDGGDPAARMRSIQAYHIDSNGWCDIGYHFVVSQSGNIYQGRSSEQRTGAHVGGQNTGNIGICLIGDFTSQTPQSQQLSPAANIVGWVADTYGIGLDRGSVKGHREWPGQSTSCPGNNLLSRIDSILQEAGGGTPTTPEPLEIEVNYLGADNFYGQGSSGALPDALPGDVFQAEILLSNTTDGAIRDVYLGYLVEEPFVTASDYTIFSDHPAYDKSSWQVNSANDAEDNPAGDQLGAQGKLNMHAFSAGETKRVLLEVEATRYSYGQHDHPDVRGWLNTATDDNGTKLYGDQDGWNQQPGTNRFGEFVRDYAELDVLAEDRWSFDDNSDPANLEGWRGRGEFEQLEANSSDTGMIAMHINGPDPGIVAPDWTRIDAETYDQMVLRHRSHDGAHIKEVYWAGEDDSFSEDRVARFEASGDGELQEVVIPLGSHEGWSGTVTRLRVDVYDGEAPDSEANGWYGVDAIFFQDSDSQMTTNGGEYVDTTPVSLDGADDGGGDGGGGDDGGGTGGPDDGDAGSDAVASADGGNDVQVKGGCSSTGGTPSMSLAVWVLAALGLAVRRRQYR